MYESFLCFNVLSWRSGNRGCCEETWVHHQSGMKPVLLSRYCSSYRRVSHGWDHCLRTDLFLVRLCKHTTCQYTTHSHSRSCHICQEHLGVSIQSATLFSLYFHRCKSYLCTTLHHQGYHYRRTSMVNCTFLPLLHIPILLLWEGDNLLLSLCLWSHFRWRQAIALHRIHPAVCKQQEHLLSRSASYSRQQHLTS